jgi:hypothetical protein
LFWETKGLLKVRMNWRVKGTTLFLVIGVTVSQHFSTAVVQGEQSGWRSVAIGSSQRLEIGGATLQVDFASGAFDLTTDQTMQWIRNAVQAVTVYYGRFPVSRARILVVPVAGERGIVQGTTWGGMGGFPGFTRIRLGQHTTGKDLSEDWTMTHELVHMAFPSLPDDQHWMEEGLATYVEPIARAQAGTLPVKEVWRGMMYGMPKGEPGLNDRGLDRTHTWGRTYWGGAMFCLVADVTIRQQTGNRKGLQDALRAIVAAGGTIDKEWSLLQALEIGDRATGTTVLIDMYRKWSGSPTQVDLQSLWDELGVHLDSGGIDFYPNAPFAKIRESITAQQSHSAQEEQGR